MTPRFHTEFDYEDANWHPRIFMRQKAGFTLTELIIVMLILGAMAMVAVPRLPMASVRIHEAEGLARKLVTDLRRTRSLAIRDAATNPSGYRMVVSGDQYRLVSLATMTVIETHDLSDSVSITTGTFDFGPLGNLLAGSDQEITVSSEGHTYTLTLVSATGSVQLTES